ncbi:MAG: VWA domain-containing protein [Pseudomonadota bacterium]
MARRRRGEAETFSLSFLDCICCGFGAIVLLLVLTRIYDPVTLDRPPQEVDGLVEQLEDTLFDIRGETERLEARLKSITDQKVTAEERVNSLRGELSRLRGQFEATAGDATVAGETLGELLSARQRLTEEMRRLAARAKERTPGGPVGGIPVDSEYIVFIIDTSGSMRQFNWNLVLRKINEVLNAYPRVRGIQIMNDNGAYMFGQFSRTWMTDSAQLRRNIASRMRTWDAFSDSNPADGIAAAIRTFWSADKKISLYVFGDDFSGNSIKGVVDGVADINKPDASGRPRVRIHAIGFPIGFGGIGSSDNRSTKFAALMRELCRRNGGTFVALTERG